MARNRSTRSKTRMKAERKDCHEFFGIIRFHILGAGILTGPSLRTSSIALLRCAVNASPA